MRRAPPFDTALAEPRAIDPRSGFNVPHSELVKEYRGGWVARRFADKPHPLDMPFRLPPPMVLRNARPEPPEESIALPIIWEDSEYPIVLESGEAIVGEAGVVVTL